MGPIKATNAKVDVAVVAAVPNTQPNFSHKTESVAISSAHSTPLYLLMGSRISFHFLQRIQISCSFEMLSD